MNRACSEWLRAWCFKGWDLLPTSTLFRRVFDVCTAGCGWGS